MLHPPGRCGAHDVAADAAAEGEDRVAPLRQRAADGLLVAPRLSNASSSSAKAARLPAWSGWVTRARARKARLISAGPASSPTPNTMRARRPSMATSSLSPAPVLGARPPRILPQ